MILSGQYTTLLQLIITYGKKQRSTLRNGRKVLERKILINEETGE